MTCFKKIKALLLLAIVWSYSFSLYASELLPRSAVEVSLRGNEKLLIKLADAHVSLLQTNSAKLKITLREGEPLDVEVKNGVIQIANLDQDVFVSAGNNSKRKNSVIEISGPSLLADVHVYEGQISAQSWSKDVLLHLQKGKIQTKDCIASLKLHSQTGEISAQDNQGRLEINTYKAKISARNHDGAMTIDNFAGETVLEKNKGAIELNIGQGNAKLTQNAGALQFDVQKGNLNVLAQAGRIEGQNGEGSLTLASAGESDVNVKSKSGRVVVQTPAGTGPLLNVSTAEGELALPGSLRPNHDGSGKSFRGRMAGSGAKGSVVVHSQQGSIVIR